MPSFFPHLNFETGEPCNCGFVEHLTPPSDDLLEVNEFLSAVHVKQAAKIDWLRARPDMQDDEGQRLLTALEKLPRRLDPLFPWMVKHVKKHAPRVDRWGDPVGHIGLRFDDHPETPRFHYTDGYGDAIGHIGHESADKWADWLQDSNHELRRGVNLDGYEPHELHDRVEQHARAKEEERKDKEKIPKTVMYKLPGGYYIRRLMDHDDCRKEGQAMGHCVGGYGSQVSSGNTAIYSLRDKKGEPHATIEVKPAENWQESAKDDRTGLPMPHGGHVYQIQGKENKEPVPKYQELIAHWFKNGFKDDSRPSYRKPTTRARYVEDLRSFIDHHLNPEEADDADFEQGGWDRGVRGHVYGLADEADTIRRPAQYSWGPILDGLKPWKGWDGRHRYEHDFATPEEAGTIAQHIWEAVRGQGDEEEGRRHWEDFAYRYPRWRNEAQEVLRNLSPETDRVTDEWGEEIQHPDEVYGPWAFDQPHYQEHEQQYDYHKQRMKQEALKNHPLYHAFRELDGRMQAHLEVLPGYYPEDPPRHNYTWEPQAPYPSQFNQDDQVPGQQPLFTPHGQEPTYNYHA